MAKRAVTVVEVTIAASAATSTAVPFFGRRLAAVVTSSAWTAADISFEIKVPQLGSWMKVVDNQGGLVKMTSVATAAAEYRIPPEIADRFTGEEVRVVSTATTSEANENQGSARTLYVIVEEL